MASPAPAKVQLALADRNPLMLSALADVFERDPRFDLVFTSRTAEGFLAGCQRSSVAIGIIDWTLPEMGGEGLVTALRARGPLPRIVVYGGGEVADVARRAMAAGAAGFCSRSDTPETLLDVTRAVASGQMVFPFLDVRSLGRDPVLSLTERERALLTALAHGRTNKELADLLGISVNTVKFHLRNLFEKLGVGNRAQAVAYYYSRRPASTTANGAAT